MSAYAMPGSFFLPAPTAVAGTFGTEKQATSDGSVSSSPSTSSSASNRGPLHHERAVQAEPTKPGDAGDDFPSPSFDAEGGSGGRCRDIMIAVKSASVDPVGLIQSITRRGGGPAGNGQGGLGGRRRRVGSFDGARPKASSSSSPPPPSSDPSGSPDDAIQFVLSISFNGRKYTATRTLPRLVQLRNDLLREARERGAGLVNRSGGGARNGLHRRRWRRGEGSGGEGSDSSSDTEGSDFEVGDDADDDDDYGFDVTLIPELPIGEGMSDTAAAAARGGGVQGGAVASFAGRGFTRLQAVMRSYCPAVEGWLRHVADVVPPSTSPSLTKFLWEPLSANSGESADALAAGDAAGEDGGEEDPRPPTSGSPRGVGGGNPSLSSSFVHGSRKSLSKSRSVRTLDSIDEDEDDGDEGQ